MCTKDCIFAVFSFSAFCHLSRCYVGLFVLSNAVVLGHSWISISLRSAVLCQDKTYLHISPIHQRSEMVECYIYESIISPRQTEISEKFIIIHCHFIIFQYFVHCMLRAYCGEHRLEKRPWRLYTVFLASSFHWEQVIHLFFTFHYGLFWLVHLLVRCIIFFSSFSIICTSF